jgi:2-oxoglutarate ferredoxin oxidoreductase subunit beta
MLSELEGATYLERVTVNNVANVRKAKKAIRKAFEYQLEGVGYSVVEVVSTCPTNWGKTPQESFEWMRQNMLPYYPLGVYKDVVADGYANAAEAALERAKDCPIAQQKKED